VSSAIVFIERLRFFHYVFDGADQIEGQFRRIVMLAGEDFLEGADGVFELDVLARKAGELFRYVEGLREELLDAAGAVDGLLVFIGELIDTEDGNDVLKIFVALKDALDLLRGVVMIVADDAGIENARGGSERIDGGVDAEFGDGARKIGGGVKMREGCGGCRICLFVPRGLESIQRGDRALHGGGNTILGFAHFGGEVGLITDG